MKTIALRFACLALSLLSGCQLFSANAKQVIEGIILNAENDTPLAYVNIGIIDTPSGTVSAPDGSFTLHLDALPEGVPAVIKVSHIGYQDQTINLQDIGVNKPIIIRLEPAAFLLETVQVSAKQLFIETLGSDKTDTKMNVSFSISKEPNQNLGSAVARKFRTKNKLTNLDSLAFFVRQNNFDTVRFRINIHQVVDRKPGALLHQKEILVEVTGQQRGWITTDLSPYQINTSEDFMVSVEWIYHSRQGSLLQMPLAMPSIGESHYYRYGSQDQWKKYGGMSSAMYLVVKKE